MNSSSFATVNPATEEQIQTFSVFTTGETEAALARGKKLPIVSEATCASTCTTPFKPCSHITEEQGPAGQDNHNRDGKDYF
jgi:hypothetical protein